MSLFSTLFQPKLVPSSKVWPPFKAGCYLVVACILLQSALLMAASIESNESVEQYSEIVLPFNSTVAGHSYESTAVFTQAVIQDECLDCNRKTCQCCSNNIFLSASLMSDVHAIALSFHRYQIVRTDIFYDLLLRPPKA